MRLDITEIQILDEMGLVATVSVLDDNVAEIKLGDMRANHTAESWRELADKVSEAIELMFPK